MGLHGDYDFLWMSMIDHDDYGLPKVTMVDHG